MEFVIIGILIIVIFILSMVLLGQRQKVKEGEKTEEENAELRTQLEQLTKRYNDLRMRKSLMENAKTGGEDPHD